MAKSGLLSRTLALRRVESVDPETTVRHVDQLDEESLDAFYRALNGADSLRATETDLEPGTIIIFTENYRIERA